MSHQEYIAQLDEEQLDRLIELAQGKLKAIRDSGWVRLWVVGTDSINYAWFSVDDYAGAVAELGQLGKKFAAEGKFEELSLENTAYRPGEAKSLLLRTANDKKA